MFYHEASPSSDLRHIVLSFWEFAVPDDCASPIDHEIFPDGCVSFIYFRNRQNGIRWMVMNGPHFESVTKTVNAGDVFWGMRISPAAVAAFLRPEISRIFESVPFEPSGSSLSSQLMDMLENVNDLQNAVNVFESAIRAIDPPITADMKIAEAVRIIDENCGEIRIDELASRLDLGERQLQRRFKFSSGLSPKQFARIRRIRATAVVLSENETLNWADRAAEMGFADQSHLAHEFVSLTKRSPKSFATKIGRIEHGNLVK
jgi:AraC-like DNA-binding protein